MCPQRETIGTVKLWDYSLRAKAKDDKCHCLWLHKVSGKKLSNFLWHGLCWSKMPQWLSTIFSFNRRKFWNTAKRKTTFSTKPNPEVYNPLAAYFRELKGRSKGNPKKREFYETLSLHIIHFTVEVYLRDFHLAVSLC